MFLHSTVFCVSRRKVDCWAEELFHIWYPSIFDSAQKRVAGTSFVIDGIITLPVVVVITIAVPVDVVVQHSAQTWSTLVDICGGLVALHKCTWLLIAWTNQGGMLSLITDPPRPLHMDNGKGSQARVDYLPPHKPNVGLGYLLCPDGSQAPQFTVLYNALQLLSTSVSSAHLTEPETHLLLRQRITPKLQYTLHTTSFTRTQCSRLDTLLRKNVLPKLRLNRHYPGAVLYGPTCYGGMEFLNVFPLQLQTQLLYLLKQLRWNKTVANDIRVTLETTQLCSGLINPIMEFVSPPISYLGSSNASLWIEDIWTPILQHDGDASLMEAFLSIPGVMNCTLRRANTV